MVLAFADIERALQIGIALGVFLNGRYTDMLRKVNRLIRIVFGRDAEKDIEQIFGANQLFEWDSHLVAGMKSQIEPKHRLGGIDCTNEILARVASLQNRHVRIEDVDFIVDARSEHQNLGVPQTSAYQ